MNYEEFKQEVADRIKEFLPEKYENADVSIQTVVKNNDQKLDGLMVKLEDSNIAPNIYLNQFYEQHEDGRPMDDILAAIADVRTQHEMSQDFDVSKLTDDEQAEIRNKTLGFIFQQYNLLPKLNILDNVKLPLLYKGLKEQEQTRLAKEALRRVGIENKSLHKPSQLSGGQQQRASIARALAGSPSVILADEPTGALDSKTSKEVIDFLIELNKQGNTIILITHDNSIAAKAKRVIRVHDGKIIYDGDASGDEIIKSTVLSLKNKEGE